MSRLAAELPRCMVGFLAGAGAYYWSAPCFKSNARRRPGHHSGTGSTARQPVAGRVVKWLYRQADAAAFRKSVRRISTGLSPNDERFNQRFLSPDMAQLILLRRPTIGGGEACAKRAAKRPASSASIWSG